MERQHSPLSAGGESHPLSRSANDKGTTTSLCNHLTPATGAHPTVVVEENNLNEARLLDPGGSKAKKPEEGATCLLLFRHASLPFSSSRRSAPFVLLHLRSTSGTDSSIPTQLHAGIYSWWPTREDAEEQARMHRRWRPLVRAW